MACLAFIPSANIYGRLTECQRSSRNWQCSDDKTDALREPEVLQVNTIIKIRKVANNK